MIYLGIDPGVSGGLAVISDSIVEAHGLPETETDTYLLFLSILQKFAVKKAMIERVHSSPMQGPAAAFTFGKSYGFLRGCLVGLRVPFDEVTPKKWQTTLGCLSKGNKNITKAKAQALFPQIKCTHAISDALLIAEYLRRAELKSTPYYQEQSDASLLLE